MSGHGQKLSRNMEKAIAALLACPSIPEAARMVNVADSTMSRWLRLGIFQAAYRDARRRLLTQAIGQLQTAMCSAVSTLREVMENAEAPASARVGAARAVIDLGIKAAETEDLEQRIKILEKRLENNIYERIEKPYCQT